MDGTFPRGLSHGEARERLRAEGANALPDRERHGIAALFLGVVREPMFLLLIGAAAIYLVLGDLREALVLAASIVAIVAITVVQERRTERAIEALRDLSSPRALVIREGREMRIAGREVVRGDLMLLREGDRVAADARLLEAHDFMVDESLLTGESVPVAKRAPPGEGAQAQVFSGSLVVRGTGMGEVFATGPRSELGRIGAMLATLDTSKTSLEVETARLVRVFAAVGLALCVLVAALYYGTRGDALAGILAGLTLAMSLLPEEFPVVLTVFLALGAMRIARHGVLTRRLPAVEMLGAATVLCCDKTGTLTENRMQVAECWRGAWRAAKRWEAGDRSLLEAAALACEDRPFDPMERAIREAGGAPAASPQRRYAMSDAFLAVTHAYRGPEGAFAVMKGAPEAVVAACDLDEASRGRALEAAAKGARRGLRVLAVARAEWAGAEWPPEPRGLPLRLLGLIALADPVRATVPAAIALCRRAGIRVVMITGDHPATARAIALQAGIDAGEPLTGTELDRLDDRALAAAVGGRTVFARVRPEQKLRLVKALREAGELVAMTGDGVNDAPALKAAHIGIAMGRRGTDVAREAAALVLLEDDFTSIVGTVRLGRRIYDNIRNAMQFLVAVHVPMAGMALLPLAAGWPLLVFPVHVVFLEFVIDPACSLVFEAERGDPALMDRPPRPRLQRLFTAPMLAVGVALGVSVLIAVAAVYALSLAAGIPEAQARAAAFATLVLGDLALILVTRSSSRSAIAMVRRPNGALWWIVAGTLAALGAAIYWPAAAKVFRFEAIGAAELALAAGAAALSVAWYDVYKAIRRR